MNLHAAVSDIMTPNPIRVEADARLVEVDKIFKEQNIHHIPVVREGHLVGMISKVDLQFFLKGMSNDSYQEVMNQTRLKNYRADEIMTAGVSVIAPEDKITHALSIFKMNLFHALPVVDGDQLIGIITTHDIIRTLAEEASLTS